MQGQGACLRRAEGERQEAEACWAGLQISKAMHIKEMNSEINKLKGELMMTRQKDGGVFLSLET